MKMPRHFLLAASVASLAMSQAVLADEDVPTVTDSFEEVVIEPPVPDDFFIVDENDGRVAPDDQTVVEEETSGSRGDTTGLDDDPTRFRGGQSEGDEDTTTSEEEDLTGEGDIVLGEEEDLTKDKDYLAGQEEDLLTAYYYDSPPEHLLGAWEPVDKANAEVVNAANFAVGALRAKLGIVDSSMAASAKRVLPTWWNAPKKKNSSEVSLLSITRASQKVVSGTKYRINIKLIYKGEKRKARVVVWQRPWVEQQYRLLKCVWLDK